MESAPERWLRNIRLSGFTLTMLVLVILAVVVLAPSLKLLVEQQQEMAALEVEVGEQRDSVNNLEDEVARWSDPESVVARARRLIQCSAGGPSGLLDGRCPPRVLLFSERPTRGGIATPQADVATYAGGSVVVRLFQCVEDA